MVQAGIPSVRPRQTQGVWLTNSPSRLYYNRSTLEQAMDELQQTGFTAIYPNVWSRGTTFHQSRFAPVEPALLKAGIKLDPICAISKEGRQRGMKVIPWFEYGLMEPADAAVVKEHSEWVLTRRNGNPVMTMHGKEMVWLNSPRTQGCANGSLAWLWK